ncbi:MAG: hypothetical protein QOH64_113 [Acidimicrobiaceae bacterium]|jgi:hypothetical protein
MGQPITVVEHESHAHPGVVRFEVNRPLSGMGHERYLSADEVDNVRPVDEVARRLFATGKVAGIHINGSVITVDLAKGAAPDGLADVIRDLFLFYKPGDPPPPDPT